MIYNGQVVATVANNIEERLYFAKTFFGAFAIF